MSTTTPTDAATADPGAMLDAYEARLKKLKKQVVAEIHAYPPPIPRCDAQFNHLLEERDRILDELRRLNELRASLPNLPPGEHYRAILDFVSASSFAAQLA